MVQEAEFAPYMTSKVKGRSGIYAEIIYEADRRLPDYRIDLKAIPWSRALHLVRSGRVNALLGTYLRPQERPWLRRYSGTIMNEDIYVFCRKGVAQKDWFFPADYSGLVFGNNQGFETPGKAFFEMVDQGEIYLNEEQTTELNLRLLNLGRADCYVQDKTVVDPILEAEGYDKVEPIRQLTSESVHVGFSEAWASDAANRFIDDLDRVLKAMKADGTIDQIVSRHVLN